MAASVFARLRGMARKLRIQYAGSICHVMNPGDRRGPIFDGDRKKGQGPVL